MFTILKQFYKFGNNKYRYRYKYLFLKSLHKNLKINRQKTHSHTHTTLVPTVVCTSSPSGRFKTGLLFGCKAEM